MNRTAKRILAGVLTVAIVGGGIGGGLYAWKQHRTKANPVEVERVERYADYNWGSQSSTSGMATSDYVQELYPEADKIIAEIVVSEGQDVKKGDVLLRYDTEKLEIDVAQAEHDLAQVNHDIETNTAELARVRKIRPYVPAPEPAPEPEPEPEPLPESEAELCTEVTSLSQAFAGTGTSDDPYRFLCTADCRVDPALLQTLLGLQKAAVPVTPADKEEPEQPTETEKPTQPSSEEPSSEEPSSETPSSEPSSPEESPSEDASDEPESSSAESSEPQTEDPSDPAPESTEGAKASGIRVAAAGNLSGLGRTVLSENETEAPDYYTLTEPVCVRFEVHEGDNEKLLLLYAWGIDAERGIYFEPQEIPEYDEPEEEPYIPPVVPVYPEEMYTAEELAGMIRDLEQTLTGLEHEKRTAELALETATRNLDSATVTSRIDGVVKTLTDPEEVLGSGEPFLVVSANQGFFVTGGISEALLTKAGPGTPITCSSWENGEMYFGEILEISPYPDESGQYWSGGMTNPNNSMYTFTAVIEEADSLRNGMYLDIQIETGEEVSDNFYIPKMLIREDNGSKYVFVAGEDGKLHRRTVQTGGTLWGDYLEIRSGLELTDYIAFPYGKNVKEGALVKMPEEAEFPEDPGIDPGIDPGFGPGFEPGFEGGEDFGGDEIIGGADDFGDEDFGTDDVFLPEEGMLTAGDPAGDATEGGTE